MKKVSSRSCIHSPVHEWHSGFSDLGLADNLLYIWSTHTSGALLNVSTCGHLKAFGLRRVSCRHCIQSHHHGVRCAFSNFALTKMFYHSGHIHIGDVQLYETRHVLLETFDLEMVSYISPIVLAHMSLQPRSNCNIISRCTMLLSKLLQMIYQKSPRIRPGEIDLFLQNVNVPDIQFLMLFQWKGLQ